MPSLEEEFKEFWQYFPRRIGKLAAFKAYAKARRMASAEQILDGVMRYRQHLPEDSQYICHATTFLNQGRWEDDYTEPERKPKPKLAIYEPYVAPWKKQANG